MNSAKRAAIFLVALVFAAPLGLAAQTSPSGDAAQKNALAARVVLDAMVKALGGEAWLHEQNRMRQERVAVFFHGVPDPGTTEVFAFHQWPDHDRIEVTKHRDVVEFFLGRTGWEVTYRGKKPLDKETLDEFLRRRDHSVETAVKVWMRNPQTLLLDEGQHMAERHLADQATLISPANDAITLLIDAGTHLPLQRIFSWRDPVYHDKNIETEEYDDYHVVDGLPTPFTITQRKNGEIVRQYFVTRVVFNQRIPADFWNPNVAARKVKK